MNLLLLLSALLSALAGLGGSVRAPVAAQVERSVAAPEVRVARSVGQRPMIKLPDGRFAEAIGRSFALAAAEPVWAGRRRE